MKTRLWLWTFLMTVLFVSNVMAESYTVKRGDSFSRIAERYGVAVKEISAANPQVKNINKIQIGWKLEIPAGYVVIKKSQKDFAQVKIKKSGRIKIGKLQRIVGREIGPYWTNTGADKYRGTLKEGLKILGYSVEEQAGLIQAVTSGESSFAIINHVSKGGMVVAEDGSKYLMVKMLSGAGNIITGSDGVISNWSDKNKVEAGKIYSFGNSYLLLPLRCKNPTMLLKVSKPVVTPPEENRPSPPPYMKIPPIENGSNPSNKDRDSWDWYLGGGNYKNKVDSDDNHGYYYWSKFRYRPLWFNVGENYLGIKSYGLGFVGFLAGGKGVASELYDYDWNEAAIGVTAKIYAKRSDYDVDLMAGRLWNNGSWDGAETNEQIDDFLLFSAHGNFYREDPTAEWFRKFELNIEYRLPFNTEVKKGTENDNQVIELTYLQWIKKFDIFGDDSVVFSTGVTIAPGYEWGAVDKDYLKVGPSFEISSYNNVVAGFSVLSYKFQGDGQWHPFSGYISADGLYNALKAFQVSSISEEELRGLEGSKLLKNPADYLY